LSPEQQAPEPQPPPAPEPHQAAEPEAPEPQVAEPQAAESQVAESELAESQPTEPAPSEPATGRSLTLAPSSEPAVVEPHTAAAVAASFERLSFVVENQPHPPPFAVSGGGVTLEDITRDILTPVIKAWLDDNLPAIVQRRVDEEVERITRSRVR
jgi:hypothetical protein